MVCKELRVVPSKVVVEYQVLVKYQMLVVSMSFQRTDKIRFQVSSVIHFELTVAEQMVGYTVSQKSKPVIPLYLFSYIYSLHAPKFFRVGPSQLFVHS